MILVDSSIWIDHLSGNNRRTTHAGNRAPASTIEIRTNTDRFLVSSETLELVRPTESDIISIANRVYRTTKEANIHSTELLIEDAPRELFAGHLPVWKVAFDDNISTRVYVSEQSGQVVAHRNKWSTLHDWAFRLHFMDYNGGKNFNNPLTWIFAAGMLWFIFTGLWLLKRIYFRR